MQTHLIANKSTYRDSLRLKEFQQSWEKTIQILWRNCFLDYQVTELGELLSDNLLDNLLFNVGAHHGLLILLGNSVICIFKRFSSVIIIDSERHCEYTWPCLKKARGAVPVVIC